MRDPPLIRRLPGGRIHLSDGPIDLIVQAFGAPAAVARAHDGAAARFVTILDELCAELALLRRPAGGAWPEGATARRMAAAVAPYAADMFITPMAAVAGAVADEILAALVAAAPVERAYVNNGGDIALHLAPGQAFSVGMVDRPDRPSLFGTARIAAADPVRGLATSGRHGRSFSLGIADAVTILAESAAAADAAATVVANAVDLPGHPAVVRVPAISLQPDSDLGDRLVTRGLGSVSAAETYQALAAGTAQARRLRDAGTIVAAALHLNGATRAVGPVAPEQPSREALHAAG